MKNYNNNLKMTYKYLLALMLVLLAVVVKSEGVLRVENPMIDDKPVMIEETVAEPEVVPV